MEDFCPEPLVAVRANSAGNNPSPALPVPGTARRERERGRQNTAHMHCIIFDELCSVLYRAAFRLPPGLYPLDILS